MIEKNGIEINYMPEQTKGVFEVLSNQTFISDYTLVGGTALSIQLKHRLSEDLDFIFDGDELNINSIKRNIAKVFTTYKIIRQDKSWQIGFILNQVKVTFFSAGSIALPFRVKERSFTYKKLTIGHVITIAVLKMSAIAHRNTIRDYYDLYWICKHRHPLLEVINETKKLIPALSPVTYTETLIYTKDIEENDISGHLEPTEIITKEQIAVFFTKELIKIKEDI
ncbi:nucleotidyl transferase AbiEii/AbiGii toxin family protein [Bacteroidota bacterium]